MQVERFHNKCLPGHLFAFYILTELIFFKKKKWFYKIYFNILGEYMQHFFHVQKVSKDNRNILWLILCINVSICTPLYKLVCRNNFQLCNRKRIMFSIDCFGFKIHVRVEDKAAKKLRLASLHFDFLRVAVIKFMSWLLGFKGRWLFHLSYKKLAFCCISYLFYGDILLSNLIILIIIIIGTLIKKKRKFSSYILGTSDGGGCRVIYEERLPNIWGNAQIFSHIQYED